MSQIPPSANPCNAYPPQRHTSTPTACTLTLKLTSLFTHPLNHLYAILLAFALLTYGLYLLTPNLRRFCPNQKPLRPTPLMEYNASFERLVVNLKRVVHLGACEEVRGVYEREREGWGAL
ncbi:hypothetical protein IFR05_015204, partial [Cadophora sp. M221]